jgi:DNA-binding transcriptional regulator YdaS (Cro superfamily)
MDSESIRAIKAAVEAAGSQPALAKRIGFAQMSISRWVNGVQPVSPRAVLKIEDATGVSRHDLRPDLYPREEPAQ